MTEVEYPTDEELKFWWVCYRKTPYLSVTEAQSVADQYVTDGDKTEPFKCSINDHWHVGRRPSSTRRPSRMGPSILKKYWRRTINKPTIQELREAFRLGLGRPLLKEN